MAVSVVLSKNGGPFASGGVVGHVGDVIQLKGENTSGWSSPIWTVYGPLAGTTPAGWLDGPIPGSFIFAGLTPPTFPATPWGKYMPVLVVLDGGEPTTFRATALSVPSPNYGIEALGYQEGNQFHASWQGGVDLALHAIDEITGDGGGSLPSQAGHAGQYLGTNGTVPAWSKVPVTGLSGVGASTGNTAVYDGVAASWVAASYKATDLDTTGGAAGQFLSPLGWVAVPGTLPSPWSATISSGTLTVTSSGTSGGAFFLQAEPKNAVGAAGIGALLGGKSTANGGTGGTGAVVGGDATTGAGVGGDAWLRGGKGGTGSGGNVFVGAGSNTGDATIGLVDLGYWDASGTFHKWAELSGGSGAATAIFFCDSIQQQSSDANSQSTSYALTGISTSTATPATILSIATGASRMYSVTAELLVDDGTTSGRVVLERLFRTDGSGTLSAVDAAANDLTPTTGQKNGFAGDLVVNGTAIEVHVIGKASTTAKWRGAVTVTRGKYA